MGHTPLHWAAFKGHVACVTLLVERGANMEAMDEVRRTASLATHRLRAPVIHTHYICCYHAAATSASLLCGADWLHGDARRCDEWASRVR
jgi:hypothetical protein